MQLSKRFVLTLVVCLAGFFSACSVIHSAAASEPAAYKSDPISGQWDASFEAENGNSFTLTLNLQLEGDKVTGTYESAHTKGGDRISKGTWTANKNKLGLALETGHGTMVLTGILKDGKLAGEFDGGQMRGKWEAQKR